MAANREERFLMRQRGAGTRQIQDFGFDIALPGASRSPLKPIRSGRSRRTPQPKLLPQRSSRRTPKSTPLSQPTRSDDSGSIIKKRRLANTPQALQHQNGLPLKSSTGRDRVDVPPSGAKEVELQLSTINKQRGSDRVANRQTRDSAVGSENAQDLPLVDASPKKRRKKRKSIVQTIRRRSSLGPGQYAPQQGVASSPLIMNSVDSLNQVSDDLNQPDRSDQLPTVSPKENLVRKTKRRKRVSIGKLPKHRKKLVEGVYAVSASPEIHSSPLAKGQKESLSGSSLPPKERLGRLPVVDEEEEHPEQAGQDDGEDESEVDQVAKSQGNNVSITTRPKQNGTRGRPRKSDMSLVKGQIPKTAKRKFVSQEAKEPNSRNVESASNSTTSEILQKYRPIKRSTASVPIAVHRLSRVQELDEDEEDLLAGPAPFPKKVGVNAVDVLGQICREVIEKTVDSMQKGADDEHNDGSRAEWKRKKNCVEMFGDELDGRLFQMTEALDNNCALKFRLRQANKEKASLREELLELRREKEEIALQMDDVRAKHKKTSKIAQDENSLNALAQDVKLAVQRGRALPDGSNSDAAIEEKRIADIEYSLRQVARQASSVNGSGLLHRVKGFNSFLEKTIAVL